MANQRAALEEGAADPRRDYDRIAPLLPETFAERLRGLTEAAESLRLLRAAMRRSPSDPRIPLG